MAHYLDNAATTPVCKEAVAAAMNTMTNGWGNPSSLYAIGDEAKTNLKTCRKQIAQALGCKETELTFTSGGTESNNWAISGAVQLGRRTGKHIITTAIEHDAVLQPCRALEQQGYEVTRLQPDKQGQISAEQVAQALRPDTVLVSMMLVNNELGCTLPVKEAAQMAKRWQSKPLVHCDAVQGFLKIPFKASDLGVDLLSVSAHKVHAPKGIGALFIKDGVKLPPLLLGGGQENGLRSGTEASAQIAAFSAAVKAGSETAETDLAHITRLRRYAEEQLTARISGLRLLHQGGVPHILPVSMVGFRSEVVVRFLSDMGIYVSSGSACHKGKPSHVYAALKLDKKTLDGALRISFSADNTTEDIDALVSGLAQAEQQLFRSMS